MAIRDMRLHEPEEDKALAEGEETSQRPRFDPIKHIAGLKWLWAKSPKGPTTDTWLTSDRED